MTAPSSDLLLYAGLDGEMERIRRGYYTDEYFNLTRDLLTALDEAPSRMDLPIAWHDRARRYFRKIKIVASGGFDAERIQSFERLGVPVDA